MGEQEEKGPLEKPIDWLSSWKASFERIRQRFGMPVAVLLALSVVGGLVWWNWDDIAKRPGGRSLAIKITSRALIGVGERLVLQGVPIVPPRIAIGLDDSLGKQIQNFFALVDGLIGGEDLIERTILANYDDRLFDRCLRRAIAGMDQRGY
jgi:hypothetical protein